MSAARDKAILIGAGIFIAGFASGFVSLIYLLNRNADKELPCEQIPEKTAETASEEPKKKDRQETEAGE